MNLLRPELNDQYFVGRIFKYIALIENQILIHISLKFVPKDVIDSRPALVQVMAQCRIGVKPFIT